MAELLESKYMNAKTLLFVNKYFKAPPHPFNMRNDGRMSYAEWQFERGQDTVRCYDGWRGLTGRSVVDAMFGGKDVLDVGCGAAGKSIYYAANGANFVAGIDVNENLRQEASALAKEKGCESKFSFVKADSADLPFDSGAFDTAVMNDAMEHVADPERTLRECLRVLRRGGRLFVNFPPYGHPYGAHLSDAIGMPWAHLFFNENALAEVYRKLTASLPDGDERFNLRFDVGEDGVARNTYINKMTIKRFRRILLDERIAPIGDCNVRLSFYKEIPLRKFLTVPARAPILKEYFVRMVVAVIEKIG